MRCYFRGMVGVDGNRSLKCSHEDRAEDRDEVMERTCHDERMGVWGYHESFPYGTAVVLLRPLVVLVLREVQHCQQHAEVGRLVSKRPMAL